MSGWTTNARSWTGRPPAWHRAVRAAALLAAAVLACLAVWVIVPAPVRWLLPLGVAVPELSPALCALAVVVALFAWVGPRVGGRRAWSSRLALVMAAGAAGVLVVPLVRLPAALDRFDAAMAAAGWTVQTRPPLDQRQRAFSAWDLVAGLPSSRAVVQRGISIGAHGQALLSVDVYRGIDPHEAPVLIQIYGGAWQRGSPGDDEQFARYFAGRGYVVVAVDYRHAPAARWPAQIEDVSAAVVWTRQHARELGGHPERIALVGRSAGAQLALVAAYRAGPAQVAGVVSFYGPVDLVEGWRQPPRPDPIDVRDVLEQFLGGTPDAAPVLYRDASPITYASASVPPTLLVYGTRDHVVEARFGRQLDQRLHEVGARSALLEIPWAEHAFDAVPSGLSAQVALFYVERFLDHVLRPRS